MELFTNLLPPKTFSKYQTKTSQNTKQTRTIGPDAKEAYIIGDFDINIYKNDKLI